MRNKMNLKEILQKMPQNVVKVEVEYNGEGDSGYVEDPIFLDVNGMEVEVVKSLQDAVRGYAYDTLEGQHGGWEINEGSHGTLEIDVKARKSKLHHYEHIIEYNESEFEEDCE